MLSNTDLRALLFPQDPTVERLVSVGDEAISEGQLQASSIDLRSGAVRAVDDRRNGDVLRMDQGVYRLKAGGIAVVETQEKISLPADIAGIMFPKSGDLAQRGILITNFGHVDPGYSGVLTYTLVNMSTDTFDVKIGESLATLLLLPLRSPADPAWRPRRRLSDGRPATGMSDEQVRMLGSDFLAFEKRGLELIHREAQDLKREVRDMVFGLRWQVVALLVGALAAAVLPFMLTQAYNVGRLEAEIEKLQQLRATPVPRPSE